jgi:hypothetical protein
VRDAGYLVLLGLICFRLEDVTRALLGITHLSFGTVLRQMLAVLSQEVQEAIIVVLPAAVAVTLGAGRGKRDPSRDLELGAAAYIRSSPRGRCTGRRIWRRCWGRCRGSSTRHPARGPAVGGRPSSPGHHARPPAPSGPTDPAAPDAPAGGSGPLPGAGTRPAWRWPGWAPWPGQRWR